MDNYQYIINPITNRRCRVDTVLGKKIIKKYIKIQKGGEFDLGKSDCYPLLLAEAIKERSNKIRVLNDSVYGVIIMVIFGEKYKDRIKKCFIPEELKSGILIKINLVSCRPHITNVTILDKEKRLENYEAIKKEVDIQTNLYKTTKLTPECFLPHPVIRYNRDRCPHGMHYWGKNGEKANKAFIMALQNRTPPPSGSEDGVEDMDESTVDDNIVTRLGNQLNAYLERGNIDGISLIPMEGLPGYDILGRSKPPSAGYPQHIWETKYINAICQVEVQSRILMALARLLLAGAIHGDAHLNNIMGEWVSESVVEPFTMVKIIDFGRTTNAQDFIETHAKDIYQKYGTNIDHGYEGQQLHDIFNKYVRIPVRGKGWEAHEVYNVLIYVRDLINEGAVKRPEKGYSIREAVYEAKAKPPSPRATPLDKIKYLLYVTILLNMCHQPWHWATRYMTNVNSTEPPNHPYPSRQWEPFFNSDEHPKWILENLSTERMANM